MYEELSKSAAQTAGSNRSSRTRVLLPLQNLMLHRFFLSILSVRLLPSAVTPEHVPMLSQALPSDVSPRFQRVSLHCGLY
jgi:hypothetical protein